MTKARKSVKAVGLSYQDNSEYAPKVSVKGQDYQAEEILRLARRFGVPVVKRTELVQMLDKLGLDEEIPNQLFEAVALVMAQVDKKLR